MMLLMRAADVMEFESDDPGVSERRRGLRIPQQRLIHALDGTHGRCFAGRTRDVSATGLRIELPAHAAVRPGEILHIHVGLSRTGASLANRRQMIPGRVVWINRSRSSRKTMTAGVEFTVGIGAQLYAA